MKLVWVHQLRHLPVKIAIINRGNCAFVIKVKAAQDAGAVAVIMINNVAGAPIVMGGTDGTITIPAVMVSQSDGAILAGQVANNLNITLSGIQFDGDVDNGIVSHEYGHGISTRLTGGPANSSCLGSNATSTDGCNNTRENGSEGWSDYFGLMVTTNWATATVNDGPIARPIGTYAFGQTPTGGGIRNKPYSTDLTINPQTYANVGDATYCGEIHNIGEIWCTAIWEMTWAIIQQENAINTNLYNYTATGNGGNSIALKLVIEGLKLQPCSPGFIDQRDAILAADRNLYGGRHACAMWTAFAKRGMGYGASQGSSNSVLDQTASSALPPAPTIITQPTDVTVAAAANASFTADAGTDVNLIYNWQVSTDAGLTWNNISPVTITPTLTLSAVNTAMNGYKYRAQIFIGCAITTSSIVTLTVTGAPAPAIVLAPASGSSNQTVCINTPIANIVYNTSGGVTGASVAGLPAGVTGIYNAGVFTISGTPNVAGTFTYTITTAGGTPNATATGSIIVNGNGVITLTSPASTTNQSVNINTAIVNITYGTTGTTGATVVGLPTGVTGTYSGGANGVFTISGTPTVAGTFSYSITTTGGCGSSTTTGTITVTNTPGITLSSSAGTSNQNVCVNTPIVNITYSTVGGVTGASVTGLPTGTTGAYSGGANGTFTISGTPSVTGTFNYTITTSGGVATASGVITVSTPPSNPAATTPITYCQGVTAVPLAAIGTNLLWYTVATGGTGSSTAPVPNTTTVGSTTYYVSQSTGTCESGRAAIVVTINPTPLAPTVASPVTYCQNATATALTATGSNLLWYGTNATGGTGSATAVTPSTATAGSTTYYVSQTTGTCEGPRAAIVVTVTALPAAPTVTSPVTYCQNTTAIPLTAIGTNLKWYLVATGGVGSTTAPTPVTTSIGSTNYYVSQSTGTCEGPRAQIVVNVTAQTASPTVTSPVIYCQGATAVALNATGTNLLWYSSATGSTGSTTAPVPSTATAGSTTYYVSQTGTCESPRVAIVVNVNPTPAAPTVTSPLSYCQGATAAALTATGANLLWYTAANQRYRSYCCANSKYCYCRHNNLLCISNHNGLRKQQSCYNCERNSIACCTNGG